MSEHAYVGQTNIWHGLKQSSFQLLQLAEIILTHNHQNADVSG